MITISKENQKICIDLLEKCLDLLMEGKVYEAKPYLNVLYEYIVTLDKSEICEIAKMFGGENIHGKIHEHSINL